MISSLVPPHCCCCWYSLLHSTPHSTDGRGSLFTLSLSLPLETRSTRLGDRRRLFHAGGGASGTISYGKAQSLSFSAYTFGWSPVRRGKEPSQVTASGRRRKPHSIVGEERKRNGFLLSPATNHPTNQPAVISRCRSGSEGLSGAVGE